MNFTGDGHKIVDVENPGIEITVPSNNVEGMEIVYVAVKVIQFLNLNFMLAFLVYRNELARKAEIAFAIRRMLEELTVFIPVTFWSFDVSHGFNNEKSRIVRFQIESMNYSSRNYNIIAGMIIE